MLQPPDGFRFGAKPLALARSGQFAGDNHLERDNPSNRNLSRLEDDAHPAAAEFGEELVTRYGYRGRAQIARPRPRPARRPIRRRFRRLREGRTAGVDRRRAAAAGRAGLTAVKPVRAGRGFTGHATIPSNRYSRILYPRRRGLPAGRAAAVLLRQLEARRLFAVADEQFAVGDDRVVPGLGFQRGNPSQFDAALRFPLDE